MSAKEIIIHTDGSCLNNPGRGGWAAVIEEGSTRRELSGGARLSTNNRMELKAAIEALKAVPVDLSQKVLIYTDSQLMVKGIELGWARKWRANNWKRNKNDKAENPDLWGQLLAEIEKRNVKFIWTKAHVGTQENERCDELAKVAAESATAVDVVYEQSRGSAKRDDLYTASAPASVQAGLFQSKAGLAESYEVEFFSSSNQLIIRHPSKGHLAISTTEVPQLLEKMKQAIQRPERE